MGVASAKRARGAAVNFMVVVFVVDCLSKNEELWRNNKEAVIVHSLRCLLATTESEGRQSSRPHTWSLACEPHIVTFIFVLNEGRDFMDCYDIY